MNLREYKRAEEAQRSLIDELNHRIKNSWANAGKSVDEIAHALSARRVPFVFVTG